VIIKKIQILIIVRNINNGKMKITGLSGHINRVNYKGLYSLGFKKVAVAGQNEVQAKMILI